METVLQPQQLLPTLKQVHQDNLMLLQICRRSLLPGQDSNLWALLNRLELRSLYCLLNFCPAELSAPELRQYRDRMRLLQTNGSE